MLYFKKRELEYIDQQRKIIEDRKKELVGSINQQASNELKIVSQQRSDLTEHIKKLSEAKVRLQKLFNPENQDMFTQQYVGTFLEECHGPCTRVLRQHFATQLSKSTMVHGSKSGFDCRQIVGYQ